MSRRENKELHKKLLAKSSKDITDKANEFIEEHKEEFEKKFLDAGYKLEEIPNLMDKFKLDSQATLLKEFKKNLKKCYQEAHEEMKREKEQKINTGTDSNSIEKGTQTQSKKRKAAENATSLTNSQDSAKEEKTDAKTSIFAVPLPRKPRINSNSSLSSSSSNSSSDSQNSEIASESKHPAKRQKIDADPMFTEPLPMRHQSQSHRNPKNKPEDNKATNSLR